MFCKNSQLYIFRVLRQLYKQDDMHALIQKQRNQSPEFIRKPKQKKKETKNNHTQKPKQQTQEAKEYKWTPWTSHSFCTVHMALVKLEQSVT